LEHDYPPKNNHFNHKQTRDLYFRPIPYPGDIHADDQSPEEHVGINDSLSGQNYIKNILSLIALEHHFVLG